MGNWQKFTTSELKIIKEIILVFFDINNILCMRQNLHANIDVITFYEKTTDNSNKTAGIYEMQRNLIPIRYKSFIQYNDNKWGLIGSDGIDSVMLEQTAQLLAQDRREEATAIANLMCRYRNGILELATYFYPNTDRCIILNDAIIIFKGKKSLIVKKNFFDFLGIPDIIEAGKENKIDKEKEI
jgi:hypothetical protein